MDKVKVKQKVYGMDGKGEDWCAKGEAEAIGEK